MAIRIFVSVYRQSTQENSSPVIDWIGANLTGSDVISCSLFWPEINQTTGRPTKTTVITVCYGTIALEGAALSANTLLVPVYHGDTLIGDISNGVKNQIKSALAGYGLANPFLTAITWKDALVNMAADLNPNDPNIVAKVQAFDPAELA